MGVFLGGQNNGEGDNGDSGFVMFVGDVDFLGQWGNCGGIFSNVVFLCMCVEEFEEIMVMEVICLLFVEEEEWKWKEEFEKVK